MRNVNVVARAGGQRYDVQLRSASEEPQVVVGTRGRLLDHLKRGTGFIQSRKGLVLDEADEMLRMGFIEDAGNHRRGRSRRASDSSVLCNYAGSYPPHYPSFHERSAGSAHSDQRNHPSGHQPELLDCRRT